MADTEAIEISTTQEEQVQHEAALPKKKHIGASAFIGTFGTSVFIQGCTVIQGILIARLLGPVGRGEFAAVILWPNLFAGIGIFGSNIALGRISAKTGQYPELFRSSIILGLLTSGLAAMPCYWLIPSLMPTQNHDLIHLAQFYILFIPLNHLTLNMIAVDQGAGNFTYCNITRSIVNPIYIIFTIILCIRGHCSVSTFSISLLAAHFVVVFIRFILGLKRFSLFGRFYKLSQVIKSSIHFGLAGIAQPLYLQADKVIMLWLLGSDNLGIYVVALSASAVIGSVTNSAGMISFTMSAQSKSREGFGYIVRTFRVSLTLWLLFGVMLACIMPFVLPFIYGNDFISAVNPARLLIIASALAGLTHVLEQSMRGKGKAFVGLEGRLIGLLVMAVFGWLLAPAFSIFGVCLAYILGQFTCLYVVILRTRQHFQKDYIHFRNFLPDMTETINIMVAIRKKVSSKKVKYLEKN